MPRRQKLVWFALGALTSMIFSLAVALLPMRLVLDDTSTTYLILQEPMSAEEQLDAGETMSIADRAGRVMKDCRARFFETTASRGDRAPMAELPVIEQNLPAIVCIIERAKQEELTIITQARWVDPNDIAKEMEITNR